MLNPSSEKRIDWAALIQRLNGSKLPSLNEPIEPVAKVVIERPPVRESVVPRVSAVRPME